MFGALWRKGSMAGLECGESSVDVMMVFGVGCCRSSRGLGGGKSLTEFDSVGLYGVLV